MTENKFYTDESRIQEYLNTTISEGDADQFIIAAQEYIDQYTERNFRADATASTRLYDGNGTQVLDIDDCVSVTTVEIGDNFWADSFTTIASSGTDRYYTDPRNNTQEGLPINKIILRTRNFIEGYGNQRITAKWGYSTVPPTDIQFAATVLAAGMYNFARGGTGEVASERIGNYQVSYDVQGEAGGFNDLKRAMEILDNYQRIRI